jgi:hypothetical protein
VSTSGGTTDEARGTSTCAAALVDGEAVRRELAAAKVARGQVVSKAGERLVVVLGARDGARRSERREGGWRMGQGAALGGGQLVLLAPEALLTLGQVQLQGGGAVVATANVADEAARAAVERGRRVWPRGLRARRQLACGSWRWRGERKGVVKRCSQGRARSSWVEARDGFCRMLAYVAAGEKGDNS